MNKIIFLILIIGCNAHADQSKVPAPDNEDAKMQVEVDPSAYRLNKIPKNKNVHLTKKVKTKKNVEHVPLKPEREAVFAKVKGIKPLVAKYDELDKDTLYIRARHQTLTKLKNSYPAFSENILISLQKEIQKAEAPAEKSNTGTKH